jgi:redox-sensitive bicupin YhaK (pirin superfamily)
VVPDAIEMRPGGTRFRTVTQGTDTRHSFSFGTHYDPGNVGFGPLLVHNDDRVSTGDGYADHPHADAEILTWVLAGSLVHVDSTGHRGLVVPGLAQRLSAGAGVVHAERNDAFRTDPVAPVAPVRFVQMWLRPDVPGTPPAYAAGAVDLADLDVGWRPVASGDHPDAAVTVGTRGATLWVTRLAPGVSRLLPSGPRTHVFLATGAVEAEAVGPLAAGDALRLTGGTQLRLTGVRPAEVLVWTMMVP